jgi:indole-3-glycerol phosphate synthase
VATSRGITATGSILDRIVADKRQLVETARRAEPEAALRQRWAGYDPYWPLSRAIMEPRGLAPRQSPVQIVAEFKKASPSRGPLAADADPEAVSRVYTLAGAAGISILTEPNYFLGSLEDLRRVRLALSRDFPGQRPSLLRKDFVTDTYELTQARAYGADSALLIAAMLDDVLLRDLIQHADAIGVEALVEVHTEGEAERSVKAGASLFGINNRDLHTFNVDLGTTERIRPLLPPDAIVIGESGVHTRADVARLQAAGVRAILVGEAFMTAPDVAAKMAALRL